MAERTPPIFLQAGSHSAENVRLANVLQLAPAGVGKARSGVRPDGTGTLGLGGLAVTQQAAPNMSVLIAAGQVVVQGGEAAFQGAYLCTSDSAVTLAIAAADATNPRRDLIVAQVRDAAYSGAPNDWRLTVVTGAPAASPADPSLAAFPNAVVLARVAVAANANSITNANITDLRTYTAALGGVVVCTSTTRPAAGLYPGYKAFETDTGRVIVHDGTGWKVQGEAGAGTTYVPALTGVTLGTATGRWRYAGPNLIHLQLAITAGTLTLAGTPATLSLPAGIAAENFTRQVLPAAFSANTPILARVEPGATAIVLSQTDVTGANFPTGQSLVNARISGVLAVA